MPGCFSLWPSILPTAEACAITQSELSATTNMIRMKLNLSIYCFIGVELRSTVMFTVVVEPSCTNNLLLLAM